MQTVDILPSEVPREASQHFSDSLLPFVEQLLGLRDDREAAATLEGATITADGRCCGVAGDLGRGLTQAVAAGKLTDRYDFIDGLRSDQ